jgi:putative ABC transport system permease protein
LTGRSVIIWDAFRIANLSILLIIIVSVGLISGLFPALYISNFDPIHSLKATKVPRSTAAYLRKGLVVFQFIISGLLIISTVLIYQQMQLFKNKKLGFDKDQVIVARLYGKFKDKIIKDPELMRNEILKNPDILSVAKASNIIGDDLSVESVTPVGSSNPNDYPSVRVMRIDENYLTTLNIPIKEGRNFSLDFNDSAAFIINERPQKS